ncbi:MAG TPA: hypothetical protein VGL89_02340 [Candidatus Koribacter sp.]|jgi:hypothetical protein
MNVTYSVLQSAETGDVWESYRSQLFQYRYETIALLKKYLSVSLDLGRLPSVLGGELFRAKVTHYRISTFEDLVIFVADMEGCMKRLGNTAREFLAMHVFEEWSVEESARRLGHDERNAWRIYADAMDEMSEIFLRLGMLEPCDWLGHVVAQEGWFEGCPVLRRNAWSAEELLPPKKPSASVGMEACARDVG